MNMTKIKSGFLGVAASMIATASFAQAVSLDDERVGKPTPDGTWFQPNVGDVAHQGYALNVGLIILSIVICLFVVALLLIVIVRFRDTGKEPRRFSHNTPLEIAWTLIPVLILVVLAVFSVPALRAQLSIPQADVVVKITGLQWSWDYEYIEEGVYFNSYRLEKEELAEYGYMEDEYLLAVDNPMVVPVNKNIVLQITSDNVIHSWKVPSMYVMKDAVPGRTEVTFFNADREGIYFGQCSELCGKDHAYMPIVVKVVSEEEYQEWLAGAKEEFASIPSAFEVASTN